MVGEETATARAQTLQDFTVGIGLFVVTIATVLSAFFGFLGPFSVGVSGEEVAQSDRIADTLVGNLSTGSQPNELAADPLADALAKSDADLRARWGLGPAVQFNVSVRALNGSEAISVGGRRLATEGAYAGEAATTTVRIVTLDADATACEPACRLVVRTW